jgi:hypothetical protein
MSWLQITIIYLSGMIITWLLWRDNMMVGYWLQDSVTLCGWPVLVVFLAFVYLNAWRKQ